MGTASDAAAQALAGVVVDESSGAPVGSVGLRLVAPDGTVLEAISSTEGTFEFESVAEGAYELTAMAAGYAPLSTSLTLSAGERSPLLVRLVPEAIPLEPLHVEVEGRPARLVETGFYDRRSLGIGTFFDPASVARSGAGHSQAERFLLSLQNRAPARCDRERVPVFLDGRPVGGRPVDGPRPTVTLSELVVTELAAVEIYADAGGLPGFALDRNTIYCGAVVAWSSRMTAPRVGEIPKIEVTLCEPAGRGGETTVEGTVEDELTAVRLPAAQVRASFPNAEGDGWREIEVRTDSLGRFRVCDVPVGTKVTLAPSYGPHAQDGTFFEAAPDTRVGLTVQVTVPGSLVGRVLEEEMGTPIRGQVPLVLVGTDHRTLSDTSGRFAFENLPPGTYDVRADCGGYNSGQPRVEVTESGQARVTVHIRKVVRGPRDRFRYTCDN